MDHGVAMCDQRRGRYFGNGCVDGMLPTTLPVSYVKKTIVPHRPSLSSLQKKWLWTCRRHDTFYVEMSLKIHFRII